MDEYVPGADGWERASPEAAGFDPAGLREAVEFAKLTDTPAEQVAYDFSDHDTWAEEEGEFGRRIGPHPDRRGGASGLVLEGGRIVAEWGDTTRVDQSFSVAKSFLSVVAGLAVDRGLVEDVDDRVAGYVDDGGFASAHNRRITWRHLLRQTSEWAGTLFGKPDAVDRNRAVGKTGDLDKAADRPLREPGGFWEYNDVRINRLALSLLRVWGKPLPRVLAHEVMEPIGATRTWEWHGYYNSDVEVDGRRMHSVSGGGHWGGGLWISTRDLARVGLLLSRGGRWGDHRLLSPEWVEAATEPCPQNESYGYLFWLNTGRALWPDAPASSFAALGHGQNVLWVDPERDLVAVLRWLALADDRDDGDAIPNQNRFLRRLVGALEG